MMPEMPQTPAASQSMDLKKDRGWAVMRWSWNCRLKRRNKGQPGLSMMNLHLFGGNFVWPVYNEKASSHWVWIDRPKHHQGEVSSIPKTGEVGNWVYPSPQQLFGGMSFQDIWITLVADIKIRKPSFKKWCQNNGIKTPWAKHTKKNNGTSSVRIRVIVVRALWDQFWGSIMLFCARTRRQKLRRGGAIFGTWINGVALLVAGGNGRCGLCPQRDQWEILESSVGLGKIALKELLETWQRCGRLGIGLFVRSDQSRSVGFITNVP